MYVWIYDIDIQSFIDIDIDRTLKSHENISSRVIDAHSQAISAA